MQTKLAVGVVLIAVFGTMEAQAGSASSSQDAAPRGVLTAGRCSGFSLVFSPRAGLREFVSFPRNGSRLSFDPSAGRAWAGEEVLVAQNSSCPPDLPPGQICCCADLGDPFSCVPSPSPCPPGTFPVICLTEPDRPECQPPPPPPPEPTVRAAIEGVPSEPMHPSQFQAAACTGIKVDTPQTLSLRAFCSDISTGAIVPNCNVQIAVRATPDSGGHEHRPDATRPAGRFDPASGNTGAEGMLPTTYTVPEVSGSMEVRITGTLADGTPVAPGTATIRVGRGGLVSLAATGDGFEVTPSVGHSNNRAATSEMKAKLEELLLRFRQQLLDAGIPLGSIPTLQYSSLNLPEGGLFDVDANEDGVIDNPWGPPHCSHRFGIDADLRIRRISAEFRDDLEAAIRDRNLRFPFKVESPENSEATHWHLRR